jgi:hypothetical protein
MTDREIRLRARIDTLQDQLEEAQRLAAYWRGLVIREDCRECNGPVPDDLHQSERYCSDDCRAQARRRQYRVSKRRSRNARLVAVMVGGEGEGARG